MKPAAFEYVKPASLSDALKALRDHPDSKLLAGGQSLIPLMNFRLSHVPAIVDISHLSDLNTIEVKDGHLFVGGLVRHQQLHEDGTVREAFPALAEAAGEVGHWAIRNRGTFGGSICHADPAGELPAAVVAFHGTLILASADGEREVPADSFFYGFLTTDIQPDEILVGVRFPLVAEDVSYGFAEFARRPGDFALAGAYAEVHADGSGAVTWFGVSGGPECREVEFAATEADRKAQFREIVEEFDPLEEGPYRKHLAVVVAEQAYQKAQKGRR